MDSAVTLEDSSSRRLVEFDDAEDTVKKMTLEYGRWHFGARRVETGKRWCVFDSVANDGTGALIQVNELWRTILRIDALDYDIAVGDPMTQEMAVRFATKLALDNGGVPHVPGPKELA